MAAFSKPSSMMSMVLTVLVLLQTVAASHGHMHQHLIHRSPEAALQVRADNVVTKGTADGTAYARMEIRELAKDEDKFNLYLLAMERFQAQSKTDPMSYYQISGIHGRPYIPWNEPGPLKNTGGYCTHSFVLFGSWHRPYLALYEQSLYANAKAVVDSFPEGQRQKWENALKGFRMPYFDWAQEPTVSGEHVPKFIRDANISVTKPSGKVTIKNPLASYSFGSSLPSEMGWGPKNGFPATLRNPGSGTTSNNDAVNTAFGQARTGWRQRVYALLATRGDWGRISSSQYGMTTSRSNTDSYESLHDEIHSTVGGVEGHMSYLDVAAFDPLFWLHHTNMDRLLNMHQFLTPDTWVASGVLGMGIAQWNQGEMKDANTPLKPFMKDASGSYYTSNDVRETRALGYFYPETEARDVNQVISAINKLYGLGEKGMALDKTSSSASSSAAKTSSSSGSSSAKATSASASGKASSSSASSSGKVSSSSASSSGKASSSSAASPSGKPSSVNGGSASATLSIPNGSGKPISVSISVGGSKPSSASKPASQQPTGKPGNAHTSDKPFPGRPFKNGDYDTVLSLVGDKYALPGACKIFCFLGNKQDASKNSTAPITGGGKGNSTVPKPPSSNTPLPGKNATGVDYYSLPEYVGSHTFLGGSVAKTNASKPMLVEGSIPLTACLQGKIESGELKSLHPDDVEPYLKEHLHYKVIAPNGEEIQPEKLPNFHAKVKSCPVTPAPEGKLPTYHEYIDLPRVNIPASNPWTPPPPPVQLPANGKPTTPIGSMPMPWDEPGYCVSKQTIKYVDSNGKFLYEETY